MTGWAENLRAIAAGKYGPGEAARPARPLVAHPDPVESIEETAAPPPPGLRRAEPPRADARLEERAHVNDGPPAPPEGGGAYAPEAAEAPPLRAALRPAAPAESRAESRADATSRATAARPSADPAPKRAGEAAPAAAPAFSSYDDARSVRFAVPDRVAPEDLPPPEFPGAPERAGAEARRPERAQDGRGSEELLAPPRRPDPQPRAQGPTLEIGEISISVLPPAPGPSASSTAAPVPRGTPISSSAALRRAGIRRL